MSKLRIRVESNLKKWSLIHGYEFTSIDSYAARGHVKYKLKGKFSEYEIDQAFKKNRLRLVIIGADK